MFAKSNIVYLNIRISLCEVRKMSSLFAEKFNKARKNFRDTIKFKDRHYVSGGEKVPSDEEILHILRQL